MIQIKHYVKVYGHSPRKCRSCGNGQLFIEEFAPERSEHWERTTERCDECSFFVKKTYDIEDVYIRFLIDV
jgi:hypothetical protein